MTAEALASTFLSTQLLITKQGLDLNLMFALIGALLRSLGLSLSIIVLFNACGSNSYDLPTWIYGPTSDFCLKKHSPVGGIQFDCQMSSAQYQILSTDLAFLKNLNLKGQASEQLRSLLKLPDTKASSLLAWLEERVKVILSDNFLIKEENDEEEEEILAFNFGAHIFRLAKAQKVNRPAAKVPGIGLVNIDSPRVGLVQFLPTFFTPANVTLLQFNDKIKRLGVLFHEARHSDGNGENRGFPHTRCPKKEGIKKSILQCDNSVNGPNAIQALFLESVAENLYSLFFNQVQVSQEDPWQKIVIEILKRDLLNEASVRNQYILSSQNSPVFFDDSPECF